MSFRGVIKHINIIAKQYLFIGILLSGVLYSQDPPPEFEFHISIYQSFYFFINSDIDGDPLLEYEDWIAAFSEYDETMDGLCVNIGDEVDGDEFTDDCQDVNGDGILSSSLDVCVGSFVWSGEYTTVPVMGNDGTQWTVGYMQDEQLPKFKIYDSSEDIIYDAVPSVVYPWSTDLAFYVVNITVVRDCHGDLAGEAFIDSCDICVGGNTGLEENYLDLGCGCNVPLVGPFYEDIDGDGLGYGEEEYFCENPGIGWSENDNDPYPSCTHNYFDCNNDCGGDAIIDDCDICSGGNTGFAPNSEIDCNDECFGTAYYDECDQCVGGSTGLGPCDFESEQPDEFSFYQSTLQAFYYIVTASLNNGDYFSNQDFIAVFNGDICVGSIKWDGSFTTLPSMGDDGSEWTEGYLNAGDFPTFKMYDASTEEFYDVEVDVILELSGADETPYLGWGINDFYYVYGFVALSPDCYGIVGGDAIIDDCSVCSGGSTGLTPNADVDCAGICFGEAEIDNCGVCAGGITDNIPNSDDLGCGCFLAGPSNYYADIDNDGFGYGEIQSFCQDPGAGWTLNGDDLEPFCFNEDLSDLNVDDCGICNGDNEDIDCLGICFGSAQLDECGECNGDNSSCQSPSANSLNLFTDEDETLAIQLTGSDLNDSELSFVINQSPEHGTLTGNPDDLSQFNYAPDNNFYGQDSFTFVAFNGQFYSDEALAVIQINPVNDAPVVEHIVLEGQEDIDLDITLIGEDIEGDQLTYSVVGNPLNGSFLITGNILTYSPNPDFYGEELITYIANDGQLDSQEGLITIIVVAVNDHPVAQDVEITLYEDNLYSFTFNVEDVDNSGDQISIYIQDDIEFGILSISGLEATLLPHDDLFGDFSLSYQALDGELFSAPATLAVHILPVNDAPMLSTILNQSINEDEIFYYLLSASDIDDDQLNFSVEEVEHADVSIDGQTLLVSPEDDFNGLLLIEVSVTDGEFSDVETFILDVLPVNDTPVLSDIEDQSSLEDQAFTMDIVASDVDGDNLSYWSNSSQYADVSFTDNQLLVIPQDDWFGEINITVNVTDGEYIDSDEFVLDVLPVNDAPILSTIDEQIIDEDSSLIYQIIASDVDGDNLDYQVEDMPNAVSYTQEDTLFIIPNQDYNGLIEVTVSVADEEFSIITAFDLTILPMNDPPILDEISDQSIEENQISEVEFSAYDVDNDPLIYDYYISSGYGYVEIEDDILIITPNQNWFGELIVNFIVSDGEYFVQQEFEVEVIEIDDPPVAYDISSTTSEDQSLSINLISSDPDTDSSELIYSISTEPEHGDVTISGAVVEYIPESDYNGSDQFLFNVNDGTTLSDPATVTIDVVPINDPPTAQDVEYNAVSGSVEFDLNSVIEDIDGDALEVIFITQNYGSETILTLFDGEIQDLGNNIFLYSAPLEMAYFDFILYKVTDGLSESMVQTITFNLMGREMPRDMAPIAFDQDVSLLEDEISPITLIGFDVLNAFSEDASFEITSNPVYGELSSISTLLESGTDNLIQWSVDYTPDLNYYGEDSFTYKIINPDNSISESEDGAIFITINPQNDAPNIYLTIPNQTLTEDSDGNILSLDLFFLDVDNEQLSYDIFLTNNDIVEITAEDNILSIVPLENQFSDPFTVSVSASDGEFDVSQSFIVEVLAVNDPPSADSSDHEMDEDNLITIILSGTDLEYDPLSYIIYNDPTAGELELEANVVTYQPNQDYNGTDSFGYRANDGQYNSDLAMVSLTINPINDAPVLSDIEGQSISEDSIFELIISANDVDEDDLTYYALIDDETVNSYDISDNILSITPIDDMNGDIQVTVNATDGELGDSKTFTLIVIPQPDPPELEEISNQEINEDENFVILLNATDVDGDELTFYGSSDIEGTVISVEDNLMIVDPPQDYFGDMIVTAGVTDGIYNVENSFTIFFIPQPDAPVIEPIADQSVLEATELVINVSANDPDGDQLTLSVEISNNINVTINELELIMQGQNNLSGDFEVIVTVTDGELSDQESFMLNIINVNDPPISYSQSVVLDEDDSSVIILEADDPDFDPLEFFVDTYPQFGSIVLSDGIVTYTPVNNFNGQDSFTFHASDGEEISNISTISLEVLPINDGPVIISDPSLVATEDILYSYQVIADDPEDDELSYELDAYPEGMQINDSGLITWTPIEGQLTSGEIVLVVSDGGDDGVLPFTQTFIITVEPVNDRPEVTSTPPTVAYEDQQYTYQVEVSDPDSDVFFYNLLIGPEGLVLDDSGLITWTPTEGIISSGTVAFVVWDTPTPNPTIDLPAVQEFIIDVIPVNDPPEIISTPPSNAIEDIEYLYQIEVQDIDNDIFYFSLLEAPEGMEINLNTGLLSWTPEEGILTSGNVSVIASDGLDEGMLYDIQNFAISVTPINDAPIIISTAPTEAVQGDEYIYEILIEDPDDSEFTYLLFDAPNEMTIDFETGILSWVPENGGVYGPITLKVQDGGEDFAAPSIEVFYINVQYISGPTTVVIPLHSEYNLISYSAIPEDNSIENVLSDLGTNVSSIITEGLASVQLSDGWYGSLSTIEASRGYWLRAPDDDVIGNDTLYHTIHDAIPTPNNHEYLIHPDYNLISYVGIDGVPIGDALPDDFEQNIASIIGEGVAAVQLSDGWQGNLTAFYRNKGYWIRNTLEEDTLYFSWEIPEEELLFSEGGIIKQKAIDKLNNFPYHQSSKQAFYFIDKVNLDEESLTQDDWIIAYNNNIVVGARKWGGRYTDVPAMGYDGYSSTLGYCKDGDIPNFKIYIDKTGELLDLIPSNIEPWSDLSTNIIGQLNQAAPIPGSFEFSYPYPNPFNPSTLIKFAIPSNLNVKITAYDITGRHVDTILNNKLDAGYYDITWKPSNLSSGIYLINIKTDGSDLTHKVMFIK